MSERMWKISSAFRVHNAHDFAKVNSAQVTPAVACECVRPKEGAKLKLNAFDGCPVISIRQSFMQFCVTVSESRLNMVGASLLPRWLQFTSESRKQPEITVHSHCPEQTIRKETCYVEQVDGISVLRCEELIERFRLCADGHKEMVESTTRTHTRPYGSGLACQSTSRYDDVIESAAPVISSTLGQMLDEFFQYANELQHSLEQQGLDHPSSSSSSSLAGWQFPGTVKAEAGTSSSSQHGNTGLFSWWQRKKAAKSAGNTQPSLQQLVRESGSQTQEI